MAIIKGNSVINTQVDTVPTEGSSVAVSSGGTYSALKSLENKIGDTSTLGSTLVDYVKDVESLNDIGDVVVNSITYNKANDTVKAVVNYLTHIEGEIGTLEGLIRGTSIDVSLATQLAELSQNISTHLTEWSEFKEGESADGIINTLKEIRQELASITASVPGFGAPTSSIDDNVGTPSVTVTTSGPDTAKVFNFAFKNLKGATITSVSFNANYQPTFTLSDGSTVSSTTSLRGPKGDVGATFTYENGVLKITTA